MVDLTDDSLNETTVIRTVIVKGLSLVPGAGPVLSPIADAIFPKEDDSMKVWSKISAYAKEMCQDMINQYDLSKVNDELTGLKNNLDAIRDEEEPSKKWTLINTFWMLLLNREALFFKTDRPRDYLPFFVPYATLRLAARADFACKYKELSSSDDVQHIQRCVWLWQDAKKYIVGAEVAALDCSIHRCSFVQAYDVKEGSGVGEGYRMWHCRFRDTWPGETWNEVINFDNTRDSDEVVAQRFQLAQNDKLTTRKGDVLTKYREYINKLTRPCSEWWRFQNLAVALIFGQSYLSYTDRIVDMQIDSDKVITVSLCESVTDPEANHEPTEFVRLRRDYAPVYPLSGAELTAILHSDETE